MFFNWRKFLDGRRIPYVERGPNTARDHVSIRCPLCGPADPSEHMGLHTDPRDPKWGCLRNARHRGRDPAYLVRAILRCTEEQARQEVKAQSPETDEFEETIQRLLYPQRNRTQEKRRMALKFPKEFKPMGGRNASGYAIEFEERLASRGFDRPDEVAEQYDLHYCLVGRWQQRLIIPFFDDGELVGWTGRTIDDRRKPRYLTLSAEEGALFDADMFVWERSDVARGAGTLIVVEGPMDVIKLDWHLHRGKMFRGQVTCLFGKPKRGQVEFLARVSRSYDGVLVMLDTDAYSDSQHLAQQIQELGGRECRVPKLLAADPGAMTKRQIAEFTDREVRTS